MSLTINGTLGGKPFTRMPTNCHPGASSVMIVYAKRTETTAASPDFAPTGCASLPFAPKLSGSAVVDAHDTGVAVTTTVTQAADEAASASTQLALPWPTLAPNFSALSLQNTSTPVGSATTATPLLPAPLQGKAYLTGSPASPTMTLRFPPPAVLTLVGKIDLARHTVAFPTIPDVPVTRLTVTLFGGRNALLSASCDQPSGSLGGAFTGQNGARATASQPLTLSGCPARPVTPGRPSLTGAGFSGLGAGAPVVGFTVTSGHAAPKLRSLMVGLPSGLTFVRRHLRSGIHVPALRSLAIRGGRLVITLKRALPSVDVRIAGRALHETRRLRRQKHRHLVLHVTVDGCVRHSDSPVRALRRFMAGRVIVCGVIAGVSRVWRGVLVVTALMCVVPSMASAAQSLAVTSASGFPAGGHPCTRRRSNLIPPRAPRGK